MNQVVSVKPVQENDVKLYDGKTVDSLASLSLRKKDLAKELKDVETRIKQELGALAPAIERVSGEDKIILSGKVFSVELGQRANVIIKQDDKKAFLALGEEALNLASFKVSDLEAYLTPPQLKDIIVRGRIGNRSIKVIPL